MTLPRWLADPALGEFWQRVRARFESNGLVATGRTVIALTSREERHAVGALLGVPQTRPRVTVDLAVLDDRLRQRSGVGGLTEVLPLVTGSPLADRPARRAAEALAREGPLLLALELVDQPWAAEWVAGLRSTGLLTRRPDPETVVRDAASLLSVLARPAAEGTRSRVELAAQVVGDAHALDEDRLLHQVVLRGLAAAAGQAVPTTAAGRRELWTAYGVAPDLLSRTCLVLGFAPEGDGPTEHRLQLAAEAGDPAHVTDWDLRKLTGQWSTSTPVLVCENPRVLEAIAERYAGRHPMVCTSGEPNTVVTEVLNRLVTAGTTLRYHGDFDWHGIAIANRLVGRFGVNPWLMTATDYERSARADGLPLLGPPVAPLWDPELGSAMRAFGRALHEESVLPDLMDALA